MTHASGVLPATGVSASCVGVRTLRSAQTNNSRNEAAAAPCHRSSAAIPRFSFETTTEVGMSVLRRTDMRHNDTPRVVSHGTRSALRLPAVNR